MISLLKNFILLVLELLLLAAVILLPVEEFFYKAKGDTETDEGLRKRLLSLAVRSLKTEDVPVGAVLLYNDSVVGVGYNTVMRDSVASGHAEINALTMALKKYGVKNFFKLNRDKLELLTTLEPCQMCKGAIVEYRIKKVKFMKGKDFSYWYKEKRWEILYQFKKRTIGYGEQQDSLFHLHPEYKE